VKEKDPLAVWESAYTAHYTAGDGFTGVRKISQLHYIAIKVEIEHEITGSNKEVSIKRFLE
jgi:hypothetical protein